MKLRTTASIHILLMELQMLLYSRVSNWNPYDHLMKVFLANCEELKLWRNSQKKNYTWEFKFPLEDSFVWNFFLHTKNFMIFLYFLFFHSQFSTKKTPLDSGQNLLVDFDWNNFSILIVDSMRSIQHVRFNWCVKIVKINWYLKYSHAIKASRYSILSSPFRHRTDKM